MSAIFIWEISTNVSKPFICIIGEISLDVINTRKNESSKQIKCPSFSFFRPKLIGAALQRGDAAETFQLWRRLCPSSAEKLWTLKQTHDDEKKKKTLEATLLKKRMHLSQGAHTQNFSLISTWTSALFDPVTNGDKVQAAQIHTWQWTCAFSSENCKIWNTFGKARGFLFLFCMNSSRHQSLPNRNPTWSLHCKSLLRAKTRQEWSVKSDTGLRRPHSHQA